VIIPINLANVPVATGFDYPPGKYIMKIKGSKVAANSDGQSHRLVVTSEILMGPGPSEQFKGRPMSNSYQMTDKGAPFLKRLYVAVGITEEYIAQNGGQVDTDWLVGREYKCDIIKKDNYSNITNEAPLDSAPATAAAPAMAPQPSLLQPTNAQPPMMGSAPPPVQGFSAPPPPPQKIIGS